MVAVVVFIVWDWAVALVTLYFHGPCWEGPFVTLILLGSWPLDVQLVVYREDVWAGE